MTAARVLSQDERGAVPSGVGTRARWMSVMLTPLAFGVLTACAAQEKVDEQLRADLLAASQAPANRGQFVSPTELGSPQGASPQGYTPYPGPYPGPYPQPYPPAAYPAPSPQPQPRVVYVPQRAPAVRTTSTSSGGGSSGRRSGADVVEEGRNTQKGAIIGAAAGAAIGVATSQDRVKGGAIGALGGAVLGGLIGHQVKTPP